jgi:hypothetical protein
MVVFHHSMKPPSGLYKLNFGCCIHVQKFWYPIESHHTRPCTHAYLSFLLSKDIKFPFTAVSHIIPHSGNLSREKTLTKWQKKLAQSVYRWVWHAKHFVEKPFTGGYQTTKSVVSPSSMVTLWSDALQLVSWYTLYKNGCQCCSGSHGFSLLSISILVLKLFFIHSACICRMNMIH